MPTSPVRIRSSSLRRRLSSRGGLIGIALVILSGVWGARRFGHGAEVQVATAPVTSGPIVRRITASGTMQATATVQVGAQISGTILALYADYNSVVKKGQVLATLDPALLNAARDEAAATLQEARAALAQAEANEASSAVAADDARTKLVRAEQLSARRLIPESDLDAASVAMNTATADVHAGESQVAVARAAVEQAVAALHQAEVNLEHAVIPSPIDGIVVSRNVEVGQTVAATVEAPVLFSVAADFTRMQVEVDIDQADIGGIRTGEPAAFEVEAYPDRFTGTVTEIRLQPVATLTAPASVVGMPQAFLSTTSTTSTTAPSVITYATIISVLNPQEKLRPGMTATVTLDGERIENAVRIPNAALSFRPPADVLAALDQGEDDAGHTGAPDGRMRRLWQFDGAQFTPVDVRIGLTDGEWTEMLAGSLRPGMLLVTSACQCRK